MRRLVEGLILSVLLWPAVAVPAEDKDEVKPVVSMMTTCSQLTGNFYPNDSVNWFYPEQHSQVVFFSHLLFPTAAATETHSSKKTTAGPLPLKNWHPPLVHPGAGDEETGDFNSNDAYYAEARWLGPKEELVAHYGLTMAARAEKDYQTLGKRRFIPHTFAMALGTKDNRSEAGQKRALDQAGQYRIEFLVDGNLEGISFFRIMEAGEARPLTPTVKSTGK